MSCSDSRASTRHEGLCRGQAVADSSWLLDELGFPTSHGIGDPALAIVGDFRDNFLNLLMPFDS